MRYPQLAARPLSQRRHRSNLEGTSNTELRKHRPDYWLLILMSSLLIVGAVVVYAIGPGLTIGTEYNENYYSYKQLFSIFLGVIGFMVAAFLPLERWKRYQFYVIAGAVISALLVRFVGEEINGAHRWIQLGGFSFQTAELVKLALVLGLASFLSQRRLQGRISEFSTIRNIGIVLIVVVSVVVGLQSDLGSATVMVAIIGLSAYISGLPLKRLGLAATVLAILVLFAVSASPYRRDRISTFLNPAADCQDEGYQACQALITIGSGGLFWQRTRQKCTSLRLFTRASQRLNICYYLRKVWVCRCRLYSRGLLGFI